MGTIVGGLDNCEQTWKFTNLVVFSLIYIVSGDCIKRYNTELDVK